MGITDIRVFGPQDYALSLVEVFTDQGVVGIGATGSPVAAIEAIILRCGLRDLVVGENPLECRRIWRRMFEQWQAQRGRGSEGGLAINAMAAIDMAVWDAAGKTLDLPVYKLLGGSGSDRVLAYSSGTAFESGTTAMGLKSPDELFRESRRCVDGGFLALKFGWGNHFTSLDEERLAAVREAIGPDTRLMIDFGCPAYWSPDWNAAAAIRAVGILERVDCHFFEEPMPPHDVRGHKRVTESSSIDIATGESLSTYYHFQPFLEERAVDVVQPDAAQMGVTAAFDVALSAGRRGMRCVPHGPWSALTVAAHLHILLAADRGGMIEYPGFDSLPTDGAGRLASVAQFDLVEYPPLLEDGHVRVTDAPGLGLGNFVESILEKL